MNPLEELLSALSTAPVLRGALCKGRHHLFDPPDDDEPDDVVAERHSLALALCAQCPAIIDCEKWLRSLPLRLRPTGVVAGRVVQPARKRKAS